MDALVCKKCGELMRAGTARDAMPRYAAEHPEKNWNQPMIMRTLVGYESPQGHKYDDNCELLMYRCAQGHEVGVSRRQTCPACDWKGKETRLCHQGPKVDEWPDFNLTNAAETPSQK